MSLLKQPFLFLLSLSASVPKSKSKPSLLSRKTWLKVNAGFWVRKQTTLGFLREAEGGERGVRVAVIVALGDGVSKESDFGKIKS